jgi:DNA-binding NarL/FixJ family response regulator
MIHLSPRELQVIRLKAQGKSIKCISFELGLSRGVVRNYIASIKCKLGAVDTANACVIAAGLGLLDNHIA